MKMRLLILAMLLSFCSYGQKNKINNIEFEYKHSWQNFSTKITIFSSRNNEPIILKTCIGEKCNDKTINQEAFDKVYNSIIVISPKNLIDSFEEGGDGAMTTIKIGNGSNKISYAVWGLNKEEPIVGSPDFLKAAQIILEVAKVKIDDIN